MRPTRARHLARVPKIALEELMREMVAADFYASNAKWRERGSR
jgi:hypothetical protein